MPINFLDIFQVPPRTEARLAGLLVLCWVASAGGGLEWSRRGCNLWLVYLWTCRQRKSNRCANLNIENVYNDAHIALAKDLNAEWCGLRGWFLRLWHAMWLWARGLLKSLKLWESFGGCCSLLGGELCRWPLELELVMLFLWGTHLMVDWSVVGLTRIEVGVGASLWGELCHRWPSKPAPAAPAPPAALLLTSLVAPPDCRAARKSSSGTPAKRVLSARKPCGWQSVWIDQSHQD